VLHDVTVPAAALVAPGPAPERAPAGPPVRIDVALRAGRIAAIEHGLPRGAVDVAADGALLLPGLIDNHVHYREPGAAWKEGYVTGSAASARGGATTVGEIQNNRPLVANAEQWRAKLASVAARSRIRVMPYGCALKSNLKELRELARVAPGVKLFMAADEELEVSDLATLRAIFTEVAAADGLLVLHAEHGPLVREGLKRFGERAEDFSLARSVEAERFAVERSIELAETSGARIHLFHVSSGAACAAIRSAQERGVAVSAAACAHYLLFADTEVGARGAILKCNPSIKSGDDRLALRSAVRDGVLDCIQSDHAPHPREEKGRAFANAPSGIPGADLFLPLWLALVDEGVLTLDQLVERGALGPARLHRLDDRGRIGVGALADLVLVEERDWTVAESDFASKAKLSPYVGKSFRRRAAKVWVGGKLVFDRTQGEDLAALEKAAPPPFGEEGSGGKAVCC
jgi:dihydroorotase (multifunctional complex type)